MIITNYRRRCCIYAVCVLFWLADDIYIWLVWCGVVWCCQFLSYVERPWNWLTYKSSSGKWASNRCRCLWCWRPSVALILAKRAIVDSKRTLNGWKTLVTSCTTSTAVRVNMGYHIKDGVSEKWRRSHLWRVVISEILAVRAHGYCASSTDWAYSTVQSLLLIQRLFVLI